MKRKVSKVEWFKFQNVLFFGYVFTVSIAVMLSVFLSKFLFEWYSRDISLLWLLKHITVIRVTAKKSIN